MASKPVLCAGCHYSPALDLAGTGPQGAPGGQAHDVVRDACVSQQQDAGLHGRLGPAGRHARSADTGLLHLSSRQEHQVPARRHDGDRELPELPRRHEGRRRNGGAADGWQHRRHERRQAAPSVDGPAALPVVPHGRRRQLSEAGSVAHGVRRPAHDRRVRPERMRPHRRDLRATSGSPRTAASCSASARATAASPAKAATTARTRSGRIRSTRTTTTLRRRNCRDTPAPWPSARPATHPARSPSR